MLPSKGKLKGIRDPASREVRSEFDQPRLALPSFSKAQAGYGGLTLIKAPAASGRPKSQFPARPRLEG